jgi:hypothetical protein
MIRPLPFLAALSIAYSFLQGADHARLAIIWGVQRLSVRRGKDN